MNRHNLKFDQRPWLYALCGIPIIISFFPIPLAFPIAFTMTVLEDECSPTTKISLLSIFYGWLVFGCLAIYLNDRTSKKLFSKN